MKKVKENVDKWSQLPTLLLWMIRDKLFSFIDVFHLSFVCKEWKLASESYLFNSQRRHLAPWIMQRHHTIGVPTKCEFVNVSTNEKLILELPEFLKADLVYSKQGWLLFRVRYQSSGRSLERPVTLLHLYTNTKIIMSDPGKCVRGSIGCFSSSADGSPKYLIFDASWGTCVTFCVALVGDNNWIKYSYEMGRQTDRHTSLVALENKIYCIEESGSLCIFDMSNLVWTEVRVTKIVMNPVGPYGYCRSRIMETDKCEIVRIQEVGDKGSFEFSKLNEKTNSWEVLNNSVMEGMSWFFSIRQNNQFVAKETGVMKKVYHAGWDIAWHNQIYWMVDIYDLSDGSKKSYRPNRDIQWVDMGTVFKIPPSCVGYKPPSGIANDVF